MSNGLLTMIILGAVGGLTVLIGSLWFLAAVLFAMRSARATGVVTGVRESYTQSSSMAGGRVFAPEVRFQTAEGQQVTFVSNISTSSRPQLGASVDVRYQPGDPQKAKIPGFRTWVAPVVLTVTGFFIIGVGVFVAIVTPG